MKLTREEALNNPGGIVHSNIVWNGMAAEQPDPKLVNFATAADGLHALVMNLLAYAREGVDTIATAIIKWAPAKENNVAAYIADVCSYCHCLPTDRLQPRDSGQVKAIIHHENGRVIYSDEQIQTAIDSTYPKGTTVNLHPQARELPQPTHQSIAAMADEEPAPAPRPKVPLPDLPQIQLPAALDRDTLWNWFLANGDKLFLTLTGLGLYCVHDGLFDPTWAKRITTVLGVLTYLHMHYLPAPLPVFKTRGTQLRIAAQSLE